MTVLAKPSIVMNLKLRFTPSVRVEMISDKWDTYTQDLLLSQNNHISLVGRSAYVSQRYTAVVGAFLFNLNILNWVVVN